MATPSATMSPSAIRSPRSPTAQRKMVFTQNTMPGWNAGRVATELSAMPMNSAMTIAGIGMARATKGAAKYAVTAVAAARITPGRSPRTLVAAG